MPEVSLLGWLPSMPSWRSVRRAAWRRAVKRLPDCGATPTGDGHSDLLPVVGITPLCGVSFAQMAVGQFHKPASSKLFAYRLKTVLISIIGIVWPIHFVLPKW